MEPVKRRVPSQNRSRQRYDEILTVASNLFSENGLDSVTTNEIAARAGMAIGSLYQYFHNKEAIVTALSEQYLETLRGITDDFLRKDTRTLTLEEAVERLADPVIAYHAENAAFSRIWLASDASTSVKTSIRTMDNEVRYRLEAQIQRRFPSLPGSRTQMVATVVQSALKSLLAILIRTDDPRQKESAAQEVKRMIVAYLRELSREFGDNPA